MDRAEPSKDGKRSTPSGIRKTKPFQPAFGRDFADPKVIEADALRDTVRTRNYIAKRLVECCALAVILAAIVSFVAGTYGPLAIVWGIAGPIATAVIGYYFSPVRRE